MTSILFLFLLPTFLFELRHNFFLTGNFLNFLKNNTSPKMGLIEGFWRAFKISVEHLATFLFIDNKRIQLVLLFAILFSTLKALWLKDKEIFKAFLVWLTAPILIFSFYRGHIIPYYFLLQEVMLFPAIGIFFALLWKKPSLRFLIFLFFLIFIKVNFTQWFSWQTKRSLKNKIMAMELIKKHSQDQPIYLSHTMEQGTDDGFKYLEWYLKINKKEDKNLPIYTIVAPYDWHRIKTHFHFGDYGVILPEIE